MRGAINVCVDIGLGKQIIVRMCAEAVAETMTSTIVNNKEKERNIAECDSKPTKTEVVYRLVTNKSISFTSKLLSKTTS